MAEATNIGWVRNSDGSKGATINFWIGCTKVSPACDHCYAEALSERFKWAEWGAGKPRFERLANAAKEAFRLERKAVKQGIRIRVFSNSLSDFFDAEVTDEWRDRAMQVIVSTPNLDWMILTKRPKVARDYLRKLYGGREVHHAVQNNLWLGVTAENQKMADLRIPDLLATPAARRFVSIEPLLGSVDLYNGEVDPRVGHVAKETYIGEWLEPGDGRNAAPRTGLDWVIVGGESGKEAPPMHPDWARSLRDQCVAAGVPFFFKQWGEWLPCGQSLPGCGKVHGATAVKPGRMKLHFGGTAKEAPKHAFAERGVGFSATADGRLTFRVGTKAAGNLLDGRKWEDMPEAKAEGVE